MAKRGFSE